MKNLRADLILAYVAAILTYLFWGNRHMSGIFFEIPYAIFFGKLTRDFWSFYATDVFVPVVGPIVLCLAVRSLTSSIVRRCYR